ncbi:MAG: hypothetical protein QMC65_07755 [Candidatus Poseidoniaceae archaeon]|jgi:hypothetical protein|tara:strand:- start:238 stop:1176 length:939 start_codon:yes stop_codon:yes gene_type:complete
MNGHLFDSMGGAMNDLLLTASFSDVKSRIQELAKQINTASMVHIHAPADLSGLLALSMLESAFLDTGIQYHRRFLPSHQSIPRDERVQPELPSSGLLIFIDPFEDTWTLPELPETEFIHITPLSVTVRLGSTQSERRGALDVVAQCAALAAELVPNGQKVRLLRPFASTGLWLREALDTTFDPIHTSIRDHLHAEGSFRMVPLPEVPSPAPEMIPSLSERMLSRLQKGWPKMDAASRASALSELILPTLVNPTLSTPRLEELVWHRLVIGTSDVDVMSQVFLAEKAWPDDVVQAKIHASKLADLFLKTGLLQ